MATLDAEEQTREAIRREVELVDRAIALVVQHHAYRVTVAGLRFGDQILQAVRTAALPASVRVVPLWRPDNSGTDLRVEYDPGSSA